ncbi:hypothetical protein GUJ93_ZPchr0011g27093 [Zizania palustris]|uniref:Secreted protein n=1 Tax=Zizania palustris TaxID=103762 RepID=A0A8J5WKG1_ZIZPA|nr:hypothetical protein GUJ93_ZPchr0011g27093 [Zizania palustris]
MATPMSVLLRLLMEVLIERRLHATRGSAERRTTTFRAPASPSLGSLLLQLGELPDPPDQIGAPEDKHRDQEQGRRDRSAREQGGPRGWRGWNWMRLRWEVAAG